jgi:hypothetical protein
MLNFNVTFLIVQYFILLHVGYSFASIFFLLFSDLFCALEGRPLLMVLNGLFCPLVSFKMWLTKSTGKKLVNRREETVGKLFLLLVSD